MTDEDGAGEGARKWGRHGEIIAERAAAQQVFQGDPLETVRKGCVHSIFLELQLDSKKSDARVHGTLEE